MTTKTILLLLLAAVGGWYAHRLWQELQAARAQLAHVNGRVAVLDVELAKRQRRWAWVRVIVTCIPAALAKRTT